MVESSSGGPSAGGKARARRDFLSYSSIAMGGGLAAGYGTLVVWAGRFLYPAGPPAKTWMFVTALRDMPQGTAIQFEDPTGAKIVIARQAENGDQDDFVALSSVCPHLGCQVHWQPLKKQFFCPCHNGVFDPQGKATEGPPAATEPPQSLAHYPLKVEKGLLFIEVPVERLG